MRSNSCLPSKTTDLDSSKLQRSANYSKEECHFKWFSAFLLLDFQGVLRIILKWIPNLFFRWKFSFFMFSWFDSAFSFRVYFPLAFYEMMRARIWSLHGIAFNWSDIFWSISNFLSFSCHHHKCCTPDHPRLCLWICDTSALHLFYQVGSVSFRGIDFSLQK